MPGYPYAIANAAINQLVLQLKKRFPETAVDSAMLKKLNIAPNNESYVINTFKFINILNAEGIPNPEVHDLFLEHGEVFSEGFSELIKIAYKALFDLHAEDAWKLDKQALIRFFRQEDKSTELVGKRQTDTFIRLAEISEKREALLGNNNGSNGTARPVRRNDAPKPKKTSKLKDVDNKNPSVDIPQVQITSVPNNTSASHPQGFSLAVRIEVNLPAGAEQSTYDAIFKSIRQNLIDSE